MKISLFVLWFETCLSQFLFYLHNLQVFRDLYPTNEQQAVYLECVWEADKFVLIETINEPENKDQVMDVGEDLSLGGSAIQYQSIETLLGGNYPWVCFSPSTPLLIAPHLDFLKSRQEFCRQIVTIRTIVTLVS